MNILFLNLRDIKNPQMGGAEIILYELGKRLVRAGHSVSWFSCFYKGRKAQEAIEGINIIRRGNKLSVYWHAFWYYKSLKTKPDIVFDCVNTSCWQTPLYVERKKRILYVNQPARKIFFYEYPFPIALLGFILEPLQYLSYKTTHAICYSNSIREDLMSFGLNKDSIYVFPLGLNHKRYRPIPRKSKEPTFVYVGRFVKNKRIDICVRAMRNIVGLFPKTKLYLIGYGKEEDVLKLLIEEYSLGSNVFIVNKNNVFLKDSKRDIKMKLMQRSWALLLSSVKEGWGMVVTEAAACGTPAIVSNVSGLKDSVIDYKTGLILSENPKSYELSEAMIKIIKEKDLRERLSRQALRFSKNFSWEDSFAQFQKILLDQYI